MKDETREWRKERDLKIEYAIELWYANPMISLNCLERKVGLTRSIITYHFKKNGIPTDHFKKRDMAVPFYDPHSKLADKLFEKLAQEKGQMIAEECVRINPGHSYADYLKAQKKP